MTVNTSDNRYACSNFIVAPTIAEGANYTTIAAAIAAASSGDTIFIKPGTYTEDITLKAGVNLTSFDRTVPNNNVVNVQLIGTITISATGHTLVSGLDVSPNTGPSIDLTGTNSTNTNFVNCFISNDATYAAVTGSNSNAVVTFTSCTLEAASSATAIFVMTGPIIAFSSSKQFNACVASTFAGGQFILYDGRWESGITTSSTGSFFAYHSDIIQLGNVTLTLGGSGSHQIYQSNIWGGTASALTVNTVLDIYETIINSSNTNAITGSGTINYGGLSFMGTSSTINTSVQNPKAFSTFQGGTNISSYAAGDILYASATNVLSKLAKGSDTEVLTLSGGLPSWAAPTVGDVVGPASATDNALARYSTTTGKLIQDSTVIVTDDGEMTNGSQPAFYGDLASTDSNVTGNGTTYTLGTNVALTERYDIGGNFNTNGTFTAPVTGKYFLSTYWRVSGITSAMVAGQLTIVTSNRSYTTNLQNIGAMRAGSPASDFLGFFITTLSDMDASDTATTNLTIWGGAGDTADLQVNTTSFFGMLIS